MMRIRQLWYERVKSPSMTFDRWYRGPAREAGLHKGSMAAVRSHIKAHFVDALAAYPPCASRPRHRRYVNSHDGTHQFTDNDIVRMKNSGNVYMVCLTGNDDRVYGVGLDGSNNVFLALAGNCLLNAEPHDCL